MAEEERWEQLARAFLRGVESDFSLGELREALAVTKEKAPLDPGLVKWLRQRGWDSSRRNAFAGVRWSRQEGCLDTPKPATLRS